MFNEKSNVWLQIYKYITIFLFFLIAFTGILLGVLSTKDGSPLAIIEGSFGSLVFWILIGVLAAFILLLVNMLTLQYLTNVQTIRRIMDGSEQNDG